MHSLPVNFFNWLTLGIIPKSHKEKMMALYESVIIGRQDLTPNQFEELVEGFTKIIEDFKGVIKKREIWGLRNLAYKINKNRKGHYILLNVESSSDAIAEYERLMRLNEDIIRFLTIRINSIDEKPSPLMNNKSDRSRNELVNSEVIKTTNEEV
jgi:small subunit ribosomal protein S6